MVGAMTDTKNFPAAVLWDFDGTLVDTEPLWFAAEGAFIESHGGTWSEELAHELIGSALTDGANKLLDALRSEGIEPDVETDDVVAELIDSVLASVVDGDYTWRPGARELLLGLRDRGIRCGLVSMSFRRMLETVAAELPEDTFEVIVPGDEVERGKPHPDPYLDAAAALGVDITDCIVMEDSPTGAKSGVASGAAVVAIPNLVPVAPGGRSVVLETLDGIGPDELIEAARTAGGAA